MNPINELVLVTVTNFSGTTTPDKNGKYPVMLQAIAGRMPNRNVLSGTVAERAGIEIGKTYLIQFREIGEDLVYGKSFNYIKVQEVTSPVDVVKLKQELGNPEIIVVTRPQGFENTYERQGDAVESVITERMKKGLIKPAYPRTATDHRTAADIKAGTSITGAGDQQRNLRPEDLKPDNGDVPPNYVNPDINKSQGTTNQ